MLISGSSDMDGGSRSSGTAATFGRPLRRASIWIVVCCIIFVLAWLDSKRKNKATFKCLITLTKLEDSDLFFDIAWILFNICLFNVISFNHINKLGTKRRFLWNTVARGSPPLERSPRSRLRPAGPAAAVRVANHRGRWEQEIGRFRRVSQTEKSMQHVLCELLEEEDRSHIGPRLGQVRVRFVFGSGWSF